MTDDFKYDVFLSHNSKDKPRVRNLAMRLKSEGFNVWFDEWIIAPGDNGALKAEEGLLQSRVLLLCISQSALDSNWVVLERSTAIHRDPTNIGRRFIPLILTDCDLPDTIMRYKFLDFRADSESVLSEIFASCRLEVDSIPNYTISVTGKIPELPGIFIKSAEPNNQFAILEQRFTAHTGWAHCVAISPNGKWAVSGSSDKTIKIWDLKKGTCQAIINGHTADIYALSISPDGKLILSASRDRSVRIWDATKAEQIIKLDGHTGQVTSVVVFQDNQYALSGGLDNLLKLWDITSFTCIKTINCGYDRIARISSCSVNRAGTIAISGHWNGDVRMWNLESGENIGNFRGFNDEVTTVQISTDDRLVVAGSSDTTARIWDLKTMETIGVLEGHTGEVSVALSNDGKLIASTGYSDQTIRLWNLQTGECIQIIRIINNGTLGVSFSSDDSHLIVGTSKGEVCVFRLDLNKNLKAVETTRRYVNAKVVLLGEGTVGKTSLAYRLIQDEYIINDRTHGMNIWRLELPLQINTEMEREALLWDLAGQEDYRLIHQLFLEQTALALLLINPQKEDPFVEAGEWLKALYTSIGKGPKRDVARLLIFSQIDVGGIKLSNAKIDRFKAEYGFLNWLPTSAKTGENCSDNINEGKPSTLKQLIANSIPWDKLPWTSTPRLLSELKNAVMAMRDESDIRLLRFSELAQRLEQALPNEKLSDAEMRTAVLLLANHGLVRQLNFGDLVLLRPDLINGYAGAVIRAARAHLDEIGCLSESDIYKPDFNFTGVERLKHRPDEELLLRALIQTFLDHSLCIAEDTPEGRHLVFPSQYRRDKDLPHEPFLFVSYTFSGEWQTVWTTLVVRLWYSQEFRHRELWRNAAEFETSKNKMLGLMIKKEGDGFAKISLYFDITVPDELKVLFIEYVHRHLDRYASDVLRERRYVCSKCGNPITDFEMVRKRKEARKAFITCQMCDKRVPFVDFIEQRLKSDPVARKILAMEKKTNYELDTQAMEQILIGHMMAIAGEANQIFRELAKFDYGVDGEVEFKDNDGKASGKKIYIQLKSGNSYLRKRKADGKEVFTVKNSRHLSYWITQPVDVYLVIRQKDDMSGEESIRWMNVTEYLKNRKSKQSKQIIFDGEKLDMESVWKVRDEFFQTLSANAEILN